MAPSLVRPVLHAASSAFAAKGVDSTLIAAAPPADSDALEISSQQIFLFVLTYVAYVAIYFARWHAPTTIASRLLPLAAFAIWRVFSPCS
jgi:hypothetical protein